MTSYTYAHILCLLSWGPDWRLSSKSIIQAKSLLYTRTQTEPVFSQNKAAVNGLQNENRMWGFAVHRQSRTGQKQTEIAWGAVLERTAKTAQGER